jgi:hypothetical protein
MWRSPRFFKYSALDIGRWEFNVPPSSEGGAETDSPLRYKRRRGTSNVQRSTSSNWRIVRRPGVGPVACAARATAGTVQTFVRRRKVRAGRNGFPAPLQTDVAKTRSGFGRMATRTGSPADGRSPCHNPHLPPLPDIIPFTTHAEVCP